MPAEVRALPLLAGKQQDLPLFALLQQIVQRRMEPVVVEGQQRAKSFNAGLNLGAGVELIKHLQVGFNYALGLTDDYSASKLELNGKNRGWSITAAILF